MGRRRNKELEYLFGFLFYSFLFLTVFSIIIAAIEKFFSSIPDLLILSLISLGISYLFFHKRIKIYLLMKKYKNQRVVDRIIEQILWEGETYEQVVDSLGRAKSIDLKVFKGNKREILKYNYDKYKIRYLTKVTLENGKIIGWEELNVRYKRKWFN